MPKKRIRVLLVDNEEVFREGLSRLLKEESGIEIVSLCQSGSEAIGKSQETRPDVVLVDSQISNGNVLEVVQLIARSLPETKVAVISRTETGLNSMDVLKAGGRALLSKSISVDDLIKSLGLISSGRIIISPLFAEEFLQNVASVEGASEKEDNRTDSILSEREMEIARLIARGATNKEIAAELFIAENTVKVHVKNILDKLDLKNRQQVAVYAVLQNWVSNHSDEEGNE